MDRIIDLIYMFAFGTITVVAVGIVWDIQARKKQRGDAAAKKKDLE